MIRVTSHNLSTYVGWLEEGRTFSFVRYGNGEWGCILRLMNRTPTGSQRLDIPSLRTGLLRGIQAHQEDSSYLLAMQSRTYLKRVGLLVPIEQLLRRVAPHVKWYCGEVFTKASMKGKLNPLIKQLRKMRVVVVGPMYLKKLNEKAFRCARFVPVPSRDCYTQCKGITASILKARSELEDPVVVSFSAGPAAKVLIHRLYSQIGENTFLIDFGSLWDPYVGRNTRRYHKRVTAAVQERNLQ